MMRWLWLIALAGMSGGSPEAQATGAELCRPYATAFTGLVIKYAWMRSYTACLMSETEAAPRLPATTLDAARGILPEATPIWELDAERIDTIMHLPAARPAPVMQEYVLPAPSGQGGPAVGTHDWVLKCARTHPRGWDAKTGTITKLVHRKWIRVPCPRD